MAPRPRLALGGCGKVLTLQGGQGQRAEPLLMNFLVVQTRSPTDPPNLTAPPGAIAPMLFTEISVPIHGNP